MFFYTMFVSKNCCFPSRGSQYFSPLLHCYCMPLAGVLQSIFLTTPPLLLHASCRCAAVNISHHSSIATACLLQVYFSAEFHLLRRLLLPCGGDELFIRSLSASADWATKGGKSKSAFSKTLGK